MSLISSFTKHSKLTSATKQTAQARKSEGTTADNLFKGAYQTFADIMLDDSLRADTLNHWGFALLHQAKTKTGSEAIKIYEDAIKKFEFCRLINPHYLAAAINGGVAYMDLARISKANASDELYTLAQQHFETANAIHKGTASFNLACIHALRGNQDACLQALQHSRDNGSLPEATEILADPDLDSVKQQAWFVEFIAELNKTEPKPEAEPAKEIQEDNPAETETTEEK